MREDVKRETQSNSLESEHPKRVLLLSLNRVRDIMKVEFASAKL
jgi:hypothetical protein